MRNTSVRRFLTAFCLLVALTLAVAPAALPVAVVPGDDVTIAASYGVRDIPGHRFYDRIIRSLRRLFGMSADHDSLNPPVPAPTTNP